MGYISALTYYLSLTITVVANTRTDRQTDRQTDFRTSKHA